MKTETGLPKRAGYYAVYLHLCDRPIVLWWSNKSTEWRNGCVVVSVAGWIGPLPELNQ